MANLQEMEKQVELCIEVANSTIEFNNYWWTCWLIHHVHGYSLPIHGIYTVFCSDLQ